MADNVPDADAVAVERLRCVGAVIVGKTTVPEFAHKLLTVGPPERCTRPSRYLGHRSFELGQANERLVAEKLERAEADLRF